MANYWMIPRAKRTLTSLPLVLAIASQACLDKEWDRGSTLDFEALLEQKGLKTAGTRRDQGGGGGRTYRAWMEALGFIFKEANTGFYRLTKAGEALLLAQRPLTEVVANQLIKVQYPSPYSISANVQIDCRFRVHPFQFILRLLLDEDIRGLTTEELALYVVTDGISDSDQCFRSVREKILAHRVGNPASIDDNFAGRFPSRNGRRTPEKTVASLKDIANTFVNYLEYTQIAARDISGRLELKNQLGAEEAIRSSGSFIRLNQDAVDISIEVERFQRKFGLGAGDNRDNRTFAQRTISREEISRKLVMMAFHDRARWSILDASDDILIAEIARETGIDQECVRTLLSPLSGKELDITRSSYVSMAFAGTLEATDFEKATTALLGEKGLGFDALHVGGPGNGNEPDIYIKENGMTCAGIIDTKAYSSYSISNDHRNRMLHNYIPKYRDQDGTELSFFMYVSGGFGNTFERQLSEMGEEARMGAVGMTAEELLKVVKSTAVSNDVKRARLVELSRERRILTAIDMGA